MREKPQAADFSVLLLHPLPVLAALLILFNALYLRLHHPGFWSGKLSDVGICFLLPVLLAASWVLLAKALQGLGLQRHFASPTPVARTSCLVAAAYFSALNLVPGFPRLHQTMMGFVVKNPLLPVMDWTDLFCLAFTVAAYFFIRRKLGMRTEA